VQRERVEQRRKRRRRRRARTLAQAHTSEVAVGGGGRAAHAYFDVFLSFPSGEGLQALRLSVDDAQLGLQRASGE
jgi:hypothetical protein